MNPLVLKNQKIEKWLSLVEKKQSLLVAGLDPADFELDRGDKGLPDHICSASSLFEWIDSYLEAIEPYCPGFKPNMKFFQEPWKMDVLGGIMVKWGKKFFTIADSKLADLDSSNEAELFSLAKMDFDCVTVAPYASNLEGITNDATKHGLGVISMCLMSAPTYSTTRDMLVAVKNGNREFLKKDQDWFQFSDTVYLRKYLYDASQINNYDTLGAVIGAPSEKNGLTNDHIQKSLLMMNEYINHYLVLIPGWGAQGGGIEFVQEVGKYAMINQSRELMFPNGSDSTPEDQASAAKKFAAETWKVV